MMKIPYAQTCKFWSQKVLEVMPNQGNRKDRHKKMFMAKILLKSLEKGNAGLKLRGRKHIWSPGLFRCSLALFF